MKRVRFVTTIREDLLKDIKISAIKEGLRINDLLERLLESYIKTKEPVDNKEGVK